MKTEKIYKILVIRKGRETLIERTLKGLIEYFSYTLEVGHGYNRKINLNPTTITSFVNNLQKSFTEKEAACYERTSIEYIGEVK
jgi:hypothetical protein